MKLKKIISKKILPALLASAMLLGAAAPVGVMAETNQPDISGVTIELSEDEIVMAEDISFEAGDEVDIETEGISYNKNSVTVKLESAKDSSGVDYNNNRPGSYEARYDCILTNRPISYMVTRNITVKESKKPALTSAPQGQEAAEGNGEAVQQETGEEDADSDSESESEPAAAESEPVQTSDEQTPGNEPAETEEGTSNVDDAPAAEEAEVNTEAEQADEEADAVVEEAEETEEVEEELELLNAPDSLGTVKVGRSGITELPVSSPEVNHTRLWHVTHNGVRYYGVCARASAVGPVNPELPTSATATVRYARLTEKVVNDLAKWMKSGGGTSVTTGLGKNVDIAKAAMVSMFIRADIWRDNFKNFELSYAAAHLLISDLLFGDDDNCKKGAKYDLVFKTMKDLVIEWMQDPENKALMDTCDAYIAYRWDNGTAKGRQPVMWMENVPGVIELTKKALDENGTPDPEFNVEGTTYTVYTDEACTEQANDAYGKPAEFVCDAKGNTHPLTMNMGTYYVKETKAAAGLVIDTEVYVAKLVRPKTFGAEMGRVKLSVSDSISLVRESGELEIQKVDAETVTAQGGASLQGAEFEITVESEDGINGEDDYYAQGKVFTTLTTDNKGYARLEKLPVGEYSIKETKAPKGYKLNSKSVPFTVKANEKVSLTYANGTAFDNEVIKAPFKFTKVNSNAEGMSGVEFEVRCVETGETWTVTTDSNGNYDSTKENDEAHRKVPYGTYILTELEGEANKEYTLADPITFKVPNENVIDLGEIVNRKGPHMGTTLTTADGSHIAKVQKTLTLKDKISYGDFIDYVGTTVTVKGVLFDVTTGNNVAEVEKEVTIENAEGTIEVEFTLDASGLNGHTIVAFESAFDAKGELIAQHKNPNDKKQTVWFPSIETDAMSEVTKDGVMPEKGGNVIDKVNYHALTAGEKYTLNAEIYEAVSGKQVEALSGSTGFTASGNGNGSVNVTINVPADVDIKGKTLVVFETLLDKNGKVIAEHKALTDERQTLRVPSVHTTAKDGNTGSHVGTVSKTATVVDRVYYNNLIVGKTYNAKGTLYEKSTGKEFLVKGKPVTAAKDFVAEKPDGYIDITFTFDSSALAGKTVVVFESLRHEGVEVAAHGDLSDKEQTIYYPSVKTTATDVESGTHYGSTEAETTKIHDSVEMTNLVVGEKYELNPVLMEKSSGEPLADGIYTKTVEFVAESESQTVGVDFDVKTKDVMGTSVVAFETLKQNGKAVCVHADINDKGQTVIFPSIETTATDTVTKDHVGVISENAHVEDRVYYFELEVGKEYELNGVLYDQKTGKPVKDADGNEITASMKFTPKEADGSVVLTFDVDSTLLVGETVTAFETLTKDGRKVAVHADINDKNQTVYYPSIGTTASDSFTEDNVGTSDREKATINDAVAYENLVPNETYTLKGKLIVKETGEPYIVGGKEVTAEKEFTPDKASGVENMTFTFDATGLKGQTVVVFESLEHNGAEVAAHADIKDEGQSVTFPSIHTNATDIVTKDHVGIIPSLLHLTPVSVTKIVDAVTHQGLVVGKEYTVSGVLMDKKTGKPFLDENGEKIVANKTFVADKADGKVDLVFEVKTDLLAGTTAVVYEDLIHNDVVVATHSDINDKNQSVSYPTVETSARDGQTGDHTGASREDATVIDTVKMTKLVKGQEYTVKGTLRNQETGEVMTLKDGTEEVEVTFTAESEEQTIEMEFSFDASRLESNVVVFEDLYHNGLKVAVHHDLTSKGQTVYYPTVETEAKDGKTGDHTGTVEKEAVLVDTVTCTDLIEGSRYVVDGVLMVAGEGEEDEGTQLLDNEGNPVTASVAFAVIDGKAVVNAAAIPQEGDDFTVVPEVTVDLTFRFDASLLGGKDIVAFETLSHEGIKIATHADIHDEKQTVPYPEIKTTAVDGLTQNHAGTIAEKATIVDSVEYKNLIPGYEYVVSGVLNDQETGEPLLDENGEQIVSSATFVPEEPDGVVDLTYTLNSSLLAGRTVVVFEDLFHEGIKVASHADIEDESQSVHYPKIGTTATINDKKVAEASGTIKVDDKVKYENLVPGTEYVLTGVMMDKNGKSVLKVGGNNVTSVVKFVPETADGEVTVTFTFRASGLGGKTLVAFEYLYSNGKEITCHADINDEAQTVKLTTPPSPPKTGDESNALLWSFAAIAALAVAGGAVMFSRRKRTN